MLTHRHHHSCIQKIYQIPLSRFVSTVEYLGQCDVPLCVYDLLYVDESQFAVVWNWPLLVWNFLYLQASVFFGFLSFLDVSSTVAAPSLGCSRSVLEASCAGNASRGAATLGGGRPLGLTVLSC